MLVSTVKSQIEIHYSKNNSLKHAKVTVLIPLCAV